MKNPRTHLSVLLLAALAATAARAARDPFWPLGYRPAPPPGAETAPAEPAKPAPAPTPSGEKAVSDEDWAKARKALPVSGVTKSVRPDTQETRILALINRRNHALGDTVVFDHNDIRFKWRIDALTEKELALTPLTAARLPPKPVDLNTKP